MKQKQFEQRFIVLIILLVLSFGLWIAALVNGNHPSLVFLAMVPMIVIVIALRVTKEKYDRAGYFSDRQAAAFYKECAAAGVTDVSIANEKEWSPLYTQSVGAFQSQNVRDHVRQARLVYQKGKQLTEKKGNSK